VGLHTLIQQAVKLAITLLTSLFIGKFKSHIILEIPKFTVVKKFGPMVPVVKKLGSLVSSELLLLRTCNEINFSTS